MLRNKQKKEKAAAEAAAAAENGGDKMVEGTGGEKERADTETETAPRRAQAHFLEWLSCPRGTALTKCQLRVAAAKYFLAREEEYFLRFLPNRRLLSIGAASSVRWVRRVWVVS
mgnify:CR=1 FL=1